MKRTKSNQDILQLSKKLQFTPKSKSISKLSGRGSKDLKHHKTEGPNPHSQLSVNPVEHSKTKSLKIGNSLAMVDENQELGLDTDPKVKKFGRYPARPIYVKFTYTSEPTEIL